MATVVLLDVEEARRDIMQRHLESLRLAVVPREKVVDGIPRPGTTWKVIQEQYRGMLPQLPADTILVCIHESDRQPFCVDYSQEVALALKIPTLLYGGGGRMAARRSDHGGILYRYPLAVTSQRSSLPDFETFFKRWEAPYKKERVKDCWRFLDPTLRTSSSLALRLLCQAWTMNNGKEEAPHGSFTVHAPVEPRQWFAVFGKDPGAPKAVGDIAEQMGDAQVTTQNFLAHLAELHQSGAGLTKETSQTQVDALLIALESVAQ